ncbi:hypothetical protein HZR84_14360 [Hyphobacterium sp. CCMP332]|nr:hypothetical protein HZR84_14360 [Hyphobacterium sp. CCMP332]
MNKPWKINIVFFLMAIPMIVFLYFGMDKLSDRSIQNRRCELKSEAIQTKFRGTLLSKFEDTNQHGIEKIKIKVGEMDTITSTILFADRSGLYKAIKIGDSVIKNSGDLMMIIWKSEIEIDTFYLDYHCKNEE